MDKTVQEAIGQEAIFLASIHSGISWHPGLIIQPKVLENLLVYLLWSSETLDSQHCFQLS